MTLPPSALAFDQVLLTRFNLPSPGVESLIRAQDGWLRGRVELFERYTLPSVRRQSVDDFSWLVYFDPESPRWLQDRIETWAADGRLTPVFREEAPPEVLVQDLAAATGRRHEHVMTTNLDNDDGLAVDFVARLRAVSPTDERLAVFQPDGLIRHDQQLYLHHYPRNPFRSVLEPWPLARGCWAEWHTLVDQTMPVIELPGSPSWLQVVHTTNVSNRVRGRLVGPAPYGATFGPLLDDLAPVSTAALLRERVVARPLRGVRDGARRVAKAVAFRLLGKSGLDRAKYALTGLRRRVG